MMSILLDTLIPHSDRETLPARLFELQDCANLPPRCTPNSLSHNLLPPLSLLKGHSSLPKLQLLASRDTILEPVNGILFHCGVEAQATGLQLFWACGEEAPANNIMLGQSFLNRRHSTANSQVECQDKFRLGLSHNCNTHLKHRHQYNSASSASSTSSTSKHKHCNHNTSTHNTSTYNPPIHNTSIHNTSIYYTSIHYTSIYNTSSHNTSSHSTSTHKPLKKHPPETILLPCVRDSVSICRRLSFCTYCFCSQTVVLNLTLSNQPLTSALVNLLAMIPYS